jgi:hypothetical protein
MDEKEIEEPREYPLHGSTPWYNQQAREAAERSIGRICMGFQRLEEIASSLISLLVGEDAHLGTIITAELSFRNKLGLLSSLYLFRAGVSKSPDAFKALLARLHRAEEHRNTILHSYWVKSPVCGALTRYKFTAKSGKGFVHQAEDLEPSDIEAVVTETSEAADDLLSHFETTFPNTSAAAVLAVLQRSHEASFQSTFSSEDSSELQVEP